MANLARLSGKVAIVTGSTAGIGQAIAKHLAENGAKVMISSRKKENVESTVQKLTSQNLDVAGTVCHANKAEHRKDLIQETLKTFGGIDILVNNVATSPVFGPILDVSESAWDKIFDTNVKVPFLLTKDVAPLIEKRGGGSVIFVSSIAAYHPFPLIGAYSISKTALLGMIKALVPQLTAMNIRVNGIAPGFISTHFSKTLTDNEYFGEHILNTIPMNRFGVPDDCAGAVTFLASDDARYITGETITIAGGMNSSL